MSEKNSSMNTPSKIAEILGLMEEHNKTKEWILNELKTHKQKPAINPIAMNSYEILRRCKPKFILHLLDVLRGNKLDEEFADINSFTKMYNWFFTDVVASATPPPHPVATIILLSILGILALSVVLIANFAK